MAFPRAATSGDFGMPLGIDPGIELSHLPPAPKPPRLNPPDLITPVQPEPQPDQRPTSDQNATAASSGLAATQPDPPVPTPAAGKQSQSIWSHVFSSVLLNLLSAALCVTILELLWFNWRNDPLPPNENRWSTLRVYCEVFGIAVVGVLVGFLPYFIVRGYRFWKTRKARGTKKSAREAAQKAKPADLEAQDGDRTVPGNGEDDVRRHRDRPRDHAPTTLSDISEGSSHDQFHDAQQLNVDSAIDAVAQKAFDHTSPRRGSDDRPRPGPSQPRGGPPRNDPSRPQTFTPREIFLGLDRDPPQSSAPSSSQPTKPRHARYRRRGPEEARPLSEDFSTLAELPQDAIRRARETSPTAQAFEDRRRRAEAAEHPRSPLHNLTSVHTPTKLTSITDPSEDGEKRYDSPNNATDHITYKLPNDSNPHSGDRGRGRRAGSPYPLSPPTPRSSTPRPQTPVRKPYSFNEERENQYQYQGQYQSQYRDQNENSDSINPNERLSPNAPPPWQEDASKSRSPRSDRAQSLKQDWQAGRAGEVPMHTPSPVDGTAESWAEELTERIQEKVEGKVEEKVKEKVPEKVGEKVGERVGEKVRRLRTF